MNRRLKPIVFCLIVPLGIGVLFYFRGVETEPVYQGKTLTSWLRIAIDNKPQYYWDTNLYNSSNRFQMRSSAENAVRQIGTNAISLLLTEAAYTDSYFSKTLEKITKPLGIQMPTRYLSHSYLDAVEGFDILGSSAKSALPKLIKMLEGREPGPQRTAAYCIGAIGPDAEVAIPSLMRHVKNSDEMVRYFSILSLGKIHRKAETVLPQLIDIIVETNFTPSDKEASVIAIGAFGSEGKTAIPVLLPLLTNDFSIIREAATNSIAKIARD